MPVESAADRASFFDEEEFAEAALYTAPGGGDAVPCSVVIDRGEGNEAFRQRDVEATGPERAAWINADEVPVVQARGRLVPGTIVESLFVAGDEEYEIAGPPKLDETGKMWFAELVIV